MAKEKLKFSIAGKAVLYEGKPETRVKDLFDILVRMQVDSQVALQAYRDNIDSAASCTDEIILQQLADARHAYEEKKKRKGLLENPSDQQQQQQQQESSEKPQKITLILRGRQFSYEGLPASKRDALIELLIKYNATHTQMVEAFRRNLPECTASEEEILEMVGKAKEAKEAKAARRAMKNEDAFAVSATEQELVVSEVFNNGSNTDIHNTTTNNDGQRKQQQQQQQKEKQQLIKVSASGIEAIEEIAGMSVEERDSISNFIRQVLEQPEIESSLLAEDPNMYLPANSVYHGGPHSSFSAYCGVSEDDMMSVTSRSTRGKIAIYCQEKDTVVHKVLYILPTTTFGEFSGMVESKFGRKMLLSFYEGEDVIEMDDEDVFCMFLEACKNKMLEGKRMKLMCCSPDLLKKVAEDRLTDAGTEGELKAKAFSNGRMEVRCVKTFTAHTSAVYCCSFSPKGDRFCTGSRDRSVRLWNTATGGCSVMKGGHNGFVLSCDFSPRGNRIVSSSDDHSIKVWNTATCSKVFTMKGHDDKVYCVQYNTTGDYIVSASCDHTLKVWNAETGARIVTLRGHTLGVFSCCFSNTDSGRYIVSGGDDRLIKVWEWSKGDEVGSMSGHTDTVWSCKFSHDDSRIVTASMNHELRVWNWKNGACILSWRGHQVPIHHAVYSENDNYIYSCARDWTIMIWDAKTGELCETIPGHRSTVYHMDVLGNRLLTSSLDETLKLWSITEKV